MKVTQHAPDRLHYRSPLKFFMEDLWIRILTPPVPDSLIALGIFQLWAKTVNLANILLPVH